MRDIRRLAVEYPTLYAPYAPQINSALDALEALHAALYADQGGRLAEDAGVNQSLRDALERALRAHASGAT